MAADPRRLAIYNALAASGTLAALVGTRIFFQTIPQGAAYPAVVFQRQSGRPHRTLSTYVQDDLFLVKGIATGTSSATAVDEIAEAIDAALDDATLTIAGHDHLSILRESDISYAEVDEGTLWRHRGGLFRLLSE